MGFFSGSTTVPLKRQGVYLAENVIYRDGVTKEWKNVGQEHRFKVLINACKAVSGREASGFVAEFTVLESTWQGNPAGSNAGYFCNMTKQPEAGLRDAVLFMAALYGLRQDQEALIRANIDEALMEYMCGKDPARPNPVGLWLPEQRTLTVTTKGKITDKGKGSPFTLHFWDPNPNPPLPIV